MRFLLLLCALLAPTVGWAQIAVDATSSGEGTTSTSHSHTFASGSIALICTGLRAPDGTAAAVSSVTVGGSAATLLTTANEVGTNAMRVEMWYHLSPGTGAQTVAATYNASTTRALTQVISLTGVSTTSTFNGTATDQGAATNADVNAIASAVGELGVLCGVGRTNTTTVSADATAPVSTEQLETSHTQSSSFTSFLYTEAGASSTIDMRVDLSASVQFAAIGASVRPVNGVSFGPLRRRAY